jgi:phenylalanyl-tRNA synthetase beta chain
MLISLRWLGRHIDLSGLSPEQIAGDLTLSTAEVEAVEPFLPHAREVVVGRVLSRERHPGADRLSLCRVSIGEGEPLPVVCGAANVAEGQNVALALPGTKLPSGLELQKTKIRGELSLGMICSKAELGLSDESEGIWVLPSSLTPGTKLSDALDLGDFVIDIDNKSLTHRPDLWGHRGIAREIAAIYRRPLFPLDTSLPTLGNAPPTPVRIDDPACSRYLALPIDGARALPSPLWLEALLTAVGQRSRGQLVDLSNFVMLDLGQPNHVFDRERLGPDGIVVRKAAPGEKFVALDGHERSLSEEDLLITSGGQAVALAGVVGGQSSEVRAETKHLLLEVATFDAVTVRRTSVRHGLRTDASARFEKSLDAELTAAAAGHFSRLLSELQPNVSFPAPLADVRTRTLPPKTIRLRPARVREALGAELSDDIIRDILVRLRFGVEAASDGFQVSVPSDRATKDIGIERDLVEEVGRLYGYGNIAERKLICPVEPPPFDERRALVRRVQDRLSGAAHFTETISYSFHSDELLALVGLADLPHVMLENPIVAQQSRMRRSVAPSLLAGIELNRRNRDVVRMFEIGKGYQPEHADPSQEPREQHLAALIWAAPFQGEPSFRDNSLARLHAVTADLLGSLERPAVVWGPGDAPAWAEAGRCLVARYPSGDVVATLAQVRGDVQSGLGLKGRVASDVALCEISLDVVLAAPRETRRYVPLPRFPALEVDVAVAVDKAARCEQVVAVIREAAGKECRDVELFDLYAGKAVGEGKKSLAFHVWLQAEDRTLSDTEEQKFLERLASKLQAIGAQLRDG